MQNRNPIHLAKTALSLFRAGWKLSKQERDLPRLSTRWPRLDGQSSNGFASAPYFGQIIIEEKQTSMGLRTGHNTVNEPRMWAHYRPFESERGGQVKCHGPFLYQFKTILSSIKHCRSSRNKSHSGAQRGNPHTPKQQSRQRTKEKGLKESGTTNSSSLSAWANGLSFY